MFFSSHLCSILVILEFVLQNKYLSHIKWIFVPGQKYICFRPNIFVGSVAGSALYSKWYFEVKVKKKESFDIYRNTCHSERDSSRWGVTKFTKTLNLNLLIFPNIIISSYHHHHHNHHSHHHRLPLIMWNNSQTWLLTSGLVGEGSNLNFHK